MARIYRDEDFSDSPPIYQESDFLEATLQQQPQAQAPTLGQAAATGFLGGDVESGLSLRNIAEEIGRYGPQTIGGLAGSTLGPTGAVAGAMAGESLRNLYQQSAASMGYAQPLSPMGIMSNVAGAGVGEAGGQALAGAYRALRPQVNKVLAQGIRVATGLPERATQAVLKEPEILSRALPMKEAGALYEAGTGGAKGGAEGARKLFGKSYLNAEQAADAFDELGPYMGALSDDEVLVLRQKMMGAISETSPKKQDLRRVLSRNLEQVDAELERRLPDWSGAKQAWREAKIGEEFSSWLPMNKNLSPNVLRTAAALGTAVHGITEGRLMPSLMLPLISPRMYGYGIRAASAAGKPLPSVIGAAATQRLNASR